MYYIIQQCVPLCPSSGCGAVAMDTYTRDVLGAGADIGSVCNGL